MALIWAGVACGQGESPAPTETAPEVAVPSTASQLALRLEMGDDKKVESVAFSPDGSLVAAGLFLEARLWRVADGDLVRSIDKGHTAEDLAFTPDGALLAAGLTSGGVQVSRVADGTEVQRVHRGFNNRVAFSPDGRLLATGNRDGLVWLWRAEDGEQLAELAAPIDEWIAALAFAPDGETVAAGHWDGTVHLWRAADGSLLHTLAPETDYCRADGLAFSPDGRLLAVAGARSEREHVVKVWTVSNGRLDKDLELPREAKDVAFSPDGRWLAAGSAAGITLWEMPDGILRATLDHVTEAEETDWVTSVAFSPDSTLLAAGRWIGILELWRLMP